MNDKVPHRPSRPDLLAAIQRDRARIARREPGHRSFWNSLGVLGMVGWPIALGSAGGALVGRWLDARFASGMQFTLLLMSVGLALGSYVAWKTLYRDP